MSQKPAYADLLIRIHPESATGAYPVEATLDDGSHFTSDGMRIDMEGLRATFLDPESYGCMLSDALFSGEVRSAYDRVIGRADAETEGRVRVRLWIDDRAAKLHAIPWERMYHPGLDKDAPLATLAHRPFSRYTRLEMPEAEPIRDRPVRLLFAIANPTNLPGSLTPIDVEQEVESLRKALGDTRNSDQVQVTLLPGRTGLSAELRGKLENEGYEVQDGVTGLQQILRLLPGHHIFHFLGHGHFRRQEQDVEGTAALHLERADGTWEAIKDEELAKLANVDPRPHLVFLAACDSAKREPETENPYVGLGPKLVRAGVPAVVAMQDQVPMDLAQQLTGDFYRQLLKHGVVDRALNEARNLVWRLDQVEWATPVLFMRLKTGQVIVPRQDDPPYHKEPYEPDTVRVQAGEFLMGSQPGPGIPEHETPQHKVFLPEYRIGCKPVTNGEYQYYLQHTGQTAPPELRWEYGTSPSPAQEEQPVRGVTWHEARAYCKWLAGKTKRPYTLPSEAQWERVAHEEGDSFNMLGGIREWTTTLWGEKRRTRAPRFRYPWRPDDGRDDLTANDQVRRVVRGGTARRTQRSSELPNSRGLTDNRMGFRIASNQEE